VGQGVCTRLFVRTIRAAGALMRRLGVCLGRCEACRVFFFKSASRNRRVVEHRRLVPEFMRRAEKTRRVFPRPNGYRSAAGIAHLSEIAGHGQIDGSAGVRRANVWHARMWYHVWKGHRRRRDRAANHVLEHLSLLLPERVSRNHFSHAEVSLVPEPRIHLGTKSLDRPAEAGHPGFHLHVFESPAHVIRRFGRDSKSGATVPAWCARVPFPSAP